MNVYQKINKVKKIVTCFVEDSKTSGAGAYSYVSGVQILSKIKDKMEELGLLFLPVAAEHRDYQTFNYKNSSGKEKTDFVVNGKLVYEWINCDEPSDRQRVEFEYYGQQNDISKAFGSGLTYSERYLLLKSLGVPTSEDDPDNVTEDKITKKCDTLETQKNGAKSQTKKDELSKFKQITELIKDSDLTMDSVKEWVVKKFKKDIKINDLTDEQFGLLVNALKKYIEEQPNE